MNVAESLKLGTIDSFQTCFNLIGTRTGFPHNKKTNIKYNLSTYHSRFNDKNISSI